VLNASTAQTLTPAGNTSPLFIGQFGGNSDRLNGTIDEVRIYNRALTQAEIQFDMNTPIVTVANTAPTISAIGAQATNEDTATGAIPFTVGDTETPAESLTLSGSSSNPTLVPNGNIVFGGSGANRTVTITPAANQNGTANITVTVSDGSSSTPTSFQLTVNAVNDGPTISSIANQTTTSGTAVEPVNFTVGDLETAAGSLTLSGSSNNTALVPNGNIVFGGSGANRTVTVTPVAGQTGTATITVTVSDGTLSTPTSFQLTVLGANMAPTISAIGNQVTNEDTATGAIPFTVGDTETPAGSLTLSGSSSNTTVVPNGNIVFGGSGANRTTTVTPAANQNGTVNITVTVSDGALSTPTGFQLTVNPINDAPTISALANQTTAPGVAVGPINFTVGDLETAPGSLTLNGSSNNTTLVPNANIAFGGSGANRTVTVTPVAGQTGTANITVTVSDGTLNTPTSFQLTVSAFPENLRAAYAFQEGLGTTTADASGNLNAGTLTNGPVWTTQGKYGNAITFDGVNDFVSVPDNATLDLGATGTLEGWVRLNAINRWNSVIAKGNSNSDPAHNYALEITDANRARCILGNGTGSRLVDSTVTVAAGQFFHLACTWNGTTVALYIDGVLNNSVAQNLTPAGNTSPLFIGQFGGNSDRLNGTIDEVRIYNRALSQAEIQFDMNTPIGVEGASAGGPQSTSGT
jgi:VCBS repeat-containing protein